MAFQHNNIKLTNYVNRTDYVSRRISPNRALFSYTEDDGDDVLAPGYFKAAADMFRVDDIIVINNLKGEQVDVLIVINNDENNGDIEIKSLFKD